MISKHFDSGCMRLGTNRKHQNRRQRKADKARLSVIKKCEEIRKTLSRREIEELLFENCIDCTRMAAIPQGAFAAFKVRRNLERNILISPVEERERMGKENVYSGRPQLEGWELTPVKYNSKLMNSIWGLYNRYSVHNFKKNTDSHDGVAGMFAAGAWLSKEAPQTAANAVAVVAATAQNSQILTNGNSL